MIKYLVVGKNGYIASRFLKREISGVYCTTTDKSNKQDFYLDLRSSDDFNYNLINKNTFVLFLAAISSPDYCLENYDDAFNVNVKGTKCFIDRVLSRKARVLFFSSDIVYGESKNVVDEESQTNPVGNYGRMKEEVENVFLNRKNFKVFRLSYVLSSQDKFVQYLINCMNSNEVAKVFDPLNRSVIYIDDVIDSIIEISRQWREFYPSVINMAGPHLISRKDIANSISEMFPGSLDYKVVTPDKVFYQARPQVINMKSLYIKKLLKRDTMSVQQALKNEYKIGGLK